MSNEDIYSRLQGIFDSLFLEPVKVTAALSAHDVEEWDSLMQISLIIAVEKEFGIRFATGEVEATRNVGEFADLIRKHQNAH